MVAGFVMPAGLPPQWEEEASFSGGYPDRWYHVEDPPALSGMPIAIEWDTALPPAQVNELDRFIRKARRRNADDNEDMLTEQAEVLQRWRTGNRGNKERDETIDALAQMVRELVDPDW